MSTESVIEIPISKGLTMVIRGTDKTHITRNEIIESAKNALIENYPRVIDQEFLDLIIKAIDKEINNG